MRRDVSFGNESVIEDCEGADVRYLFKTKWSKAVRMAFRKYGTIRRLFSPDIGDQMAMPLT